MNVKGGHQITLEGARNCIVTILVYYNDRVLC